MIRGSAKAAYRDNTTSALAWFPIDCISFEAPSIWHPMDKALQSSTSALILVLAENQSSCVKDGFDMNLVANDMQVHLNSSFDIIPVVSPVTDKRCAKFNPHRTLRRNWLSLLEWFDPCTIYAFSNEDSIESHDRLAGYLGVIPESFPVKLRGFGFKWSPELEDKIRGIILDGSVEAIKRWYYWKWKRKIS